MRPTSLRSDDQMLYEALLEEDRRGSGPGFHSIHNGGKVGEEKKPCSFAFAQTRHRQPPSDECLAELSTPSTPTTTLELKIIKAERDLRLLKRDKGICQLCGLNTLALHAALLFASQKISAAAPGWTGFNLAELKWAIGIRASRFPQRLWDGDHIDPQANGGSHDPANLRTACLLCHQRVTQEMFYRKVSA